MLVITLSLLVFISFVIALFLNIKPFGQVPTGERRKRMEKSPNFRNGKFWNIEVTPMMINDELTKSSKSDMKNRRPMSPIQVQKTDLKHLDTSENLFVWFGHSSYLMQLDGKRFLVDPVFIQSSPIPFINRPFAGTDVYKPDDMPDIDYLIITHDHWDHLDYKSVTALRERVGKVVCGLGVGAHFERWGYSKEAIVELDWNESFSLEDGFDIHCLTSRHFSGRGIDRNLTLWMSALLQTPSMNVYIGGDGGYGIHFAEIGQRFPNIDLAILENGQYNMRWRYIHTMPDMLPKVAKDLNPQTIITVHHSKYALSVHPWTEPIENAKKLRDDYSMNVLIPSIGEVVVLKKHSVE